MQFLQWLHVCATNFIPTRVSTCPYGKHTSVAEFQAARVVVERYDDTSPFIAGNERSGTASFAFIPMIRCLVVRAPAYTRVKQLDERFACNVSLPTGCLYLA